MGSPPPLSPGIPIFLPLFRSVDDDELIGEYAIGIALLAVRPLHADLGAFGRAEAAIDPAGVSRRIATADLDCPHLGARSRLDRDMRADRVAVGVGLLDGFLALEALVRQATLSRM